MFVNWAEDSLKRESGTKVHHANIQASKVCVICFLRFTFLSNSYHFIAFPFPLVLQAVADIIRTTLGPRSMLKMLLDASGGVSILSISFEKSELYSQMKKWNYFDIAVTSL